MVLRIQSASPALLTTVLNFFAVKWRRIRYSGKIGIPFAGHHISRSQNDCGDTKREMLSIRFITGTLESRMFVEVPAALRYLRSNNGGDGMSTDRMFVMGGAAAAAMRDREISQQEVFALRQNYPNPFSPSTTITFEITKSPTEKVSLVIFDVLGRRVRTLVDGALSPGQYSFVWNGLDDVGSHVASGLYLYRLQVDDHTATRSMTLI